MMDRVIGILIAVYMVIYTRWREWAGKSSPNY